MPLDEKKRIQISKTMSFMLRHGPEKFGLLLDPEGFVPTEEVVAALNQKIKGISQHDVKEVVERCEKGRFEVRGDDIRACYGHSVPAKITYEPVKPPETLLHGTARRFLDSIMEEGLRPMDRQYVHLTVKQELAYEVGKRRDNDPVILVIDAASAFKDGIKFYKANENFYLADSVPAMYIGVLGR